MTNRTLIFLLGLFLFYGWATVEAQVIEIKRPHRSREAKKRNKAGKELGKTRTYHNMQGGQLSWEAFYKKKIQKAYSYKINDSLSALTLTKTWGETGEINHKDLISTLNESLNLQLDDSKNLIVVFYPGPDECSLSGIGRPRRVKRWYKNLRRKANRITPTNLLFVYKTTEYLLTKDVLDWHHDPDQVMEHNFFRYHRPCGSHVIISPKNKFITIYGETGKGRILNALKKLDGNNRN